MARSMLQTKCLRNSYWVDLVATIVYIFNTNPTSVLDKMTSYEIWYKKQPNVNHFKVFGCLTYVPIHDQNRKKLDAKMNHAFLWVIIRKESLTDYSILLLIRFLLQDMCFFDRGGVYDHQKGHVKKPKSVLDDGIIVDNDNDKPANESISRSPRPPSDPSQILRASSSSSPQRKVRRLSDIYERCQNQAHEEDPIGEIVNFALLAKVDF